MVAYLKGSRHLKGLHILRYQVKRLKEWFAGSIINKTSGQDVKAYCRQRQEAGVANSTINRELAALSSAINYCNREFDWQLPNPVKGRLLKEPPGRERYLSRAEVACLIQHARQRRHGELLADFIEIAVNTGCRRGELYNLEWNRVDLTRGRESISLRAEHTKSGKPRTVPLNEPAVMAIKRRANWRSENAPGSPWVFARASGKRIGCIRNGFAKACEAAGIHDFRMHDLRHTAASWLVSDGVPLEVVKDLLGHSTIVMTQRYAHLAPHRVREAVNLMGGTSQSGHTGNQVAQLEGFIEGRKAL